MNVIDVYEEIAEKLGAIPDLRVYPYAVDNLTPPGAFVSMPEQVTYDATYGRGTDSMSLMVTVVVARGNDRTSFALLAKYADGSGSHSFKAALEAGTSESYDSLRVESVEFWASTLAGKPVLGAEFTLDVKGSGS